MKPLYLVSATPKPQSQYDNLLISKYIRKTGSLWDITFDNKKSLAQIYNAYLTKMYDDSILIFCHDDLILEDLFLQEKLNEALETYDIIGLAGIQAPIQLKHPCLWHLMGDRTNYTGAVAHFAKETIQERLMTVFGPTPRRCVLLDGVFLAINTKKILEKGLRFDENNPAKYHFYDLNFCLDANNLGLKLGTWPIWATHQSHGLEKMSDDWLQGEAYFLQKYQTR